MDLLISEGTYGDDVDEGNAIQNKHLTFKEAAMFASEAGVQRLVLTHFSPKMERPEDYLANAQSAFPAPELADPGQVITLNFLDSDHDGVAIGIAPPGAGVATVKSVDSDLVTQSRTAYGSE